MSSSVATRNVRNLENIREGLQCMRSTKRRTVVWPAVLYVADYEFRSTVYDISLGGIRLKMPLPLSAGAEVEVKIKHQVTLRACVVWQAGEFLGLQFRDSVDEVRKALGDLAVGLE